eukprot:1446834-Pleurochrysis_carterae.AAC.7
MQPYAHAAAVAAVHCVCILLPRTACEALRAYAYGIRRCTAEQISRRADEQRLASTSMHARPHEALQARVPNGVHAQYLVFAHARGLTACTSMHVRMRKRVYASAVTAHRTRRALQGTPPISRHTRLYSDRCYPFILRLLCSDQS